MRVRVFDFFSPREAMLAAATPIELGSRKEIERHKKRLEKWQDLAWQYYDEIPEIWFAHNFISNAFRRVKLFPAVVDDPTQPPRALGEEDGDLYTRATMELDRLRGLDGSHGGLLHDLTMQLSIPGEGWLLPILDEEAGREVWGIYSKDELFVGSDELWHIREFPGQQESDAITLPSDTPVARVWRRHPRWRNAPDSGMRAILEVCDELQILSRDVRASGRSRMNNGILWVPNKMKLRKADGQGDTRDGNARKIHPFVEALELGMITPIQEEGHPSAVMPLVIFAEGELITQVRHMTFDREFSELAGSQRLELLQRAASGLDLPAEVVTQKGDLNHWTMWQVDEDTYKAHLDPMLTTEVNGITEAFFKPAMRSVTDLNVVVWFDPTDLVSHPTRSKDADMALQSGAIGFPAYRRYKGYLESDAAQESDLELMERVNESKRPPAPPQGGGDTTAGPPPEPSASITAAAVPPEDVGMALRNIDFHLRAQVQVAAQAAVFRAAEKLGAKLKRHVQGNGHEGLRAQLLGVPPELVAATLGEQVVRQWFQTDEEIVDDALVPLLPVYTRLVARAQRDSRNLALHFDKDDVVDIDVVNAREAEARGLGWGALVTGLSALIATRVFKPDVVGPAVGEFDSTILVPPGLVRESLSIAGGAKGVVSPGGAVLNAITGAPQGGVATGTNVMDIFAKADMPLRGWQWVYGEGFRDHPFESHEDLDGVEFNQWDDSALAVRGEDAWLGVSYYYPGDHLYCQCDFAPVMSQAASEEAA